MGIFVKVIPSVSPQQLAGCPVVVLIQLN